jgi:hypothetical protein
MTDPANETRPYTPQEAMAVFDRIAALLAGSDVEHQIAAWFDGGAQPSDDELVAYAEAMRAAVLDREDAPETRADERLATEMQRLALQPGDVMALMVPDETDTDEAWRVAGLLHKALPGHRALVLHRQQWLESHA